MSGHCDDEVVLLDLSDAPTLPKLQFLQTKSGKGINIIESIGAKYNAVGTLLLEDEDGVKMEAIVISQYQKVPNINHHILSTWLQGGGKKPVTWSTLIDVFKKVGLTRLARSIKQLSILPPKEVHHILAQDGK